MKRTFSVLFTFALVTGMIGCAGTSQYIAAKEASDKVAVQAANDNIVTAIKDALCALPYGAILRHPEIQEAITSVCKAPSAPLLVAPKVP